MSKLLPVFPILQKCYYEHIDLGLHMLMVKNFMVKRSIVGAGAADPSVVSLSNLIYSPFSLLFNSLPVSGSIGFFVIAEGRRA